jgi:Uma2 family endonuclease
MSHPILENPEIRKSIAPISIECYHEIISKDPAYEKTELFEGMVIKKMTKGTSHNYFSDLLIQLLSSMIQPNSFLRVEKPITVGNSEPEPDISVVSGKISDYRKKNPETALFVAEISHTSLEYDRQKRFIYSRAGIPIYWIVNIDEECIEVYDTIVNDIYQSKTIYTKNETISLFNVSMDLKKFFEEN